MFHPLLRKFLYSAYQIHVTVHRPDGTSSGHTGTCFFASWGERTFVLTNRHVLDIGYTDKFPRGSVAGSVMIVGWFGSEYREVSLNNFGEAIFPDNYEEDVAIVGAPNIGYDANLGFPVPYNLAKDLFATEADFNSENLSVGDFVSFPGYPPWFDHNGRRPIMRSGTIASDPSSDYGWKLGQPSARRLAYEAFSFGGSSGSPVFANPRGLPGVKLSGETVLKEFREVRLIGINGGHLSDETSMSGQHSGISYLFKSTVISELMEKAVDRLAATGR